MVTPDPTWLHLMCVYRVQRKLRADILDTALQIVLVTVTEVRRRVPFSLLIAEDADDDEAEGHGSQRHQDLHQHQISYKHTHNINIPHAVLCEIIYYQLFKAAVSDLTIRLGLDGDGGLHSLSS